MERNDGEKWCAVVAARGDLEDLIQARVVDGCSWDGQTCFWAASEGHLDVLQWARENECPWDKRICAVAARWGHLDVLQWARENGCPWDEDTCACAAEVGHFEILQWVREKGCPWDTITCRRAASRGHVDILRWALDNGCEWDCMSYECDKVEILQLAYEYCVLFNFEVTSTNEECLEFIKGEYGEAWKHGNFELPHYWNLHIKGANE